MILAIFVVIGFASVSMADQEVNVVQKITGKIADPKLASARPDSGVIDNDSDWKKLWMAWRPNEPVQNVDFENHLVLVETAPGPNTVFANILKLTDQGDLKYETASSRMGGPGFGYLIMVVPSTGIKTVNGKSKDGQPVADKATEPKPMKTRPENGVSNRKPVTEPPSKTQTVRDPGDPESQPVVDRKPDVKEFVKVEIIGRVRTQFQSVGAETTGTLVSANGIVWELDFQRDDQFMNAALRLGNSLARITGTLTMQRQRGSIEARVRWIVLVESFESLGVAPTIQQATVPPKQPMKRADDSQPIAGDPRVEPAQKDPTQGNLQKPESVPSIPVKPQNDSKLVRQIPISFKRLSIETSDGQTQKISSDGTVLYESTSRNISNEWNTDPATLAKLHQFVGNTDWDRVPKLTRSNSSDPKEISYTISIETARSVKRIFIDRTAVPAQPTIQKFFDIIGEIARNR